MILVATWIMLATLLRGTLWSDANSSNPSISGAAYKVLLDATNRSRPDFSNDPVLNLSKKTYENMDLIAGGFGDCSAETTINEGTINAHVYLSMSVVSE